MLANRWVQPDDFSAYFGRCLAQTARHGFMLSPDNLDWMQAHGGFYNCRYDLPQREIPEVVRMMRAYGVSEGVLGPLVRGWKARKR